MIILNLHLTWPIGRIWCNSSLSPPCYTFITGLSGSCTLFFFLWFTSLVTPQSCVLVRLLLFNLLLFEIRSTQSLVLFLSVSTIFFLLILTIHVAWNFMCIVMLPNFTFLAQIYHLNFRCVYSSCQLNTTTWFSNIHIRLNMFKIYLLVSLQFRNLYTHSLPHLSLWQLCHSCWSD